MIILKSPAEINRIAKACEVLQEVFEGVSPLMQPGTPAREVDQFIEDAIRSRGGRPAFKGYSAGDGKPFPASSCISIDSEVVHGIPGNRTFKVGQIVGLDIGVELNGYFGDAARTFLIGDVKPRIKKLVEITLECLNRGIEAARAGNRLGDIGCAIQSYAEKHGYGVVRELSGHGVGKKLHEEPQIPNYGFSGRGTVLQKGMTLAIEPMINLGSHEVYSADDGWTVLTRDGKPSAHWEETIAITDGEPLILTRSNKVS
ncbi:type I methionyl aminopeptidase [bacterium]|nr:type I methionyl aminopeptidase [bacterium]MBU1651521.1 type I methionyl aminopeptidase [bacterium]MBU1881972.1 type I methionyl aminopeptidase [bacterium]